MPRRALFGHCRSAELTKRLTPRTGTLTRKQVDASVLILGTSGNIGITRPTDSYASPC
jgi:hypothetical protein